MTKNNKNNKSFVKHKVLHLALGATLVGTSFATPLGSTVSAAEKNQDIQVNTEWLGQGDGSGVEFDVNLYSNKETAAVDSQTLNEDNGWSHIFSDMPTVIPAADEDGTAEDITYTLKSTPLEDYYSVVTGNQNQGFTVLNMLKAEGEIQGQIVVRYVDQNGKEIAYRTIQSGRVNSDYAEIMPKEIKGYKNPTVTRGETTGKYEYGINIVEFTYEEAEPQVAVEGAIEVYHVDRFGNEIALRDMVSGEVDAEYSIEPKEITGYTLVTDFEIDEEEMNDKRHEFYLNNKDLIFGGNIEGQYEEGIHKVYFMYDVAEDFNADAPVRGGVIVRFVDTKGNEIAERHVEFGMTEGRDKDGKFIPAERFDVGINWMENYIKNYLGEPEADSIRDLGYGVIGVDGYTTGPYVPGFTEITYTLDVIKNDPGYENYNDVIVQHMDEYGNEIAVRDRVFAEIGSDYSVNKKKIKGYTFERVIGEPEGKISDQTTIVQFIYSKDDEEEVVINGDVIVKHVDTTGAEIAERDSHKGQLGTPYETEAKKIEGYEFVEVRGEANGVFVEGVHTVEYVYKLVEDDTTPPVDEDEDETPVVEDESEEVQLLRDTLAMYNEYKEAGLLQLKGASDVPTPDNMDEFLYNVEKLGYEGSTFFLRSGTLGSSASRQLSEIYSFLRGLADELDVVIEDSNEDEIPTDEDENANNEDENNDDETPIDEEDKDKDGNDNDNDNDGDNNNDDNANGDDNDNNNNDDNSNVNDDTTNNDDNTTNDEDDNITNDEDDNITNDEDDNITNDEDDNTTNDEDGNTNNDDATSNDDDDDDVVNATTNTNGDNNTTNRVQDAEAEGMALPDTATNTFNLMAIGASLLALAGGGLFFVNRRRNEDVSETE